MMWKSARMALDDRYEASLPEKLRVPETDESYPAAGAVIGEMAATLACFLTIALALHLLVERLGL